MSEGDMLTLTAIMRDEVTDKSVTWTSSDTSVVSVDSNGTVIAIGAGKAEVTVTTVNPGVTDTIIITVFPDAIISVSVPGTPNVINFRDDGTYYVFMLFMGAVEVEYEDTYEVINGELILPNPGPDVETEFGVFPMWPIVVVEGDTLLITVNTNNGDDIELGRFTLNEDQAALLKVTLGEADPNILLTKLAEDSTDKIIFEVDGTYIVDIMFLGAVHIHFTDSFTVENGVLNLPNPGPDVETAFGVFPMWPIVDIDDSQTVITINTNNGEDLELARFVLTAAEMALLQ
jgi:hypothetical protein